MEGFRYKLVQERLQASDSESYESVDFSHQHLGAIQIIYANNPSEVYQCQRASDSFSALRVARFDAF